ncbi:class I SAM-dependent methyltransferase [Psychromonas ossibalaenae]
MVKRPDYAPFLSDKKPSMSIKTKQNRLMFMLNRRYRRLKSDCETS